MNEDPVARCRRQSHHIGARKHLTQRAFPSHELGTARLREGRGVVGRVVIGRISGLQRGIRGGG